MEKVKEIANDVRDYVIQQRAVTHADATMDSLGTDESRLKNAAKLNADLNQLEHSAIDEHNKAQSDKH
jgi:hypothetical protein